jgi:hypothetical protein
MIKIEKKDKVIAHLYSDERRFDKMKEKELKKIKKKAKKIIFVGSQENVVKAVLSGKLDPEGVIAKASTKGELTEEQKADIRNISIQEVA